MPAFNLRWAVVVGVIFQILTFVFDIMTQCVGVLFSHAIGVVGFWIAAPLQVVYVTLACGLVFTIYYLSLVVYFTIVRPNYLSGTIFSLFIYTLQTTLTESFDWLHNIVMFFIGPPYQYTFTHLLDPFSIAIAISCALGATIMIKRFGLPALPLPLEYLSNAVAR